MAAFRFNLSEPGAPPRIAPAHAELLYAEQVALIYGNGPLAYLIHVINGLLLVYLLRELVDPGRLFWWLAALCLVALGRSLLSYAYSRASPPPRQACIWGCLATVGAGLAGGMWGLAALWVYPDQSLAHQVFLSFVLAGMAAGAVALLSALLSAALVFVVLALVPMLVRLVLEGSEMHLVMAAMGGLFLVAMVAASRTINRLVRGTLRLRRSRNTLAAMSEGVATLDAGARVEFLNPAAEALSGWRASQARNQPVEKVFRTLDEATHRPIATAAQECLRQGHGLRRQVLLLGPDGREIPVEEFAAPLRDEAGRLTGAVAVFQDATEWRRLTAQLSYQASHDPLTGLVNRREFERRLTTLLERQNRAPAAHVVCFMDLDRFKFVNDSAGHEAGDELLRQLGPRLAARVRQHDTLARLGGDEFALLLEDCPFDRGLEVAEALRETVQGFRFTWGEGTFTVGISVGLVTVTDRGLTLEELLKRADRACMGAKLAGRNRVWVYRERADNGGEGTMVITLRQALARDGFRLYRQGIRCLGDGPGERYEILLRLNDPRNGLLLPGAFMNDAERYGLLPELDRWVVGAVVSHLENNPAALKRLDWCAINLGAATLRDDAFPAFVAQRLAGSPVRPRQLCFEINETALVINLARSSRMVTALRALGCRLTVDRFGTYLSSLDYLRELPADFLKIDRLLVQNLAREELDRIMVGFVVRLGHLLGKGCIAEYVADGEGIEQLRVLGVDYVQGHGVEMPRPLDYEDN